MYFKRKLLPLTNISFLGQGTIYPDVIESVSVHGPSQTIKSHHNVGGLPDTMHLSLVEPLRFLFKDEVRKVGLALGIPADLINRHPFPGPGLAIRILGEVNAEESRFTTESRCYLYQRFEKNRTIRKSVAGRYDLVTCKKCGCNG